MESELKKYFGEVYRIGAYLVPPTLRTTTLDFVGQFPFVLGQINEHIPELGPVTYYLRKTPLGPAEGLLTTPRQPEEKTERPEWTTTNEPARPHPQCLPLRGPPSVATRGSPPRGREPATTPRVPLTRGAPAPHPESGPPAAYGTACGCLQWTDDDQSACAVV
jgi:hypothetical protein